MYRKLAYNNKKKNKNKNKNNKNKNNKNKNKNKNNNIESVRSHNKTMKELLASRPEKRA